MGIEGLQNILKHENKYKFTAFHTTVKEGHLDVINALNAFIGEIYRGESFDLHNVFTHSNINKDSSLHLAVKNNDMKIAKCLISTYTTNH